MTDWYNCTTFDIIGDLSFGKSFDCLATGGCHLWVKTIFDFVVAGTVLAKVNRWIPMRFIKMLIPKSVQQKRLDFAHSTRELVAKRLSLGEGARPDFTSFTPRNRGLEEDGKVSMSDAEITINSMVLVLAGSETTATLLSGVAYHLLRNPEAMARAVKEVREAFASDDEITFASISKLEYLLACLNEAMRIYPPVAGALFRRMESEAGVVDGHLVPPDTSTGVYQWPAHHSSGNFANPNSFVPERWLDHPDAVYADDQRDAMQPFSLGPRNCLCRSLAYVEMRLILARVLFNFDLALADPQRDWAKQDAYILRDKKPLLVKIKGAKRT